MRLIAVGPLPPGGEVMIMNPNHNLPPTELSPRRAPAPADQLHICVQCAGTLVHPFDWEAEGPRHWRVMLHCPDCQGVREGVFTQIAVDALADELDRGSSIVIRELDLLTRENMTAEIDVLVRALESDLILPCDF